MTSDAPLCCGAFSLTVGVELICLVNLLLAVFIIATVSSVEPMSLGNIDVSPFWQVVAAAWAAAGIPLIVGAGVGILYRIETFLRSYFWYIFVTLCVEGLFFLKFLISGSVCSTFAPRDMERLGTTFVCGLTDTFALFWGLIVIGISAYFLYIIWAAQMDLKKGYWPELMRYRDAWSISAEAVPYTPAPVVGSQLPSYARGSLEAWKLPMSGTVGLARSQGVPTPAYGSVQTNRSQAPPLSPRQAYSAPPSLATPVATSMAPRSPRNSGFIPSPASWTPVTTSQVL